MNLPHRSKKLEEIYVERRAIVARLLAERPLCQRCAMRAPTDIHEIRSRARSGGAKADGGRAILDEANLAALCRPCHDWVTVHPREANAEGWSAHSWGDMPLNTRAAVVIAEFDQAGPSVQLIGPYQWVVKSTTGPHWHQIDVLGWVDKTITVECSCERAYFDRTWCVHVEQLLEALPTQWPALNEVIDQSRLYAAA